MPVRRIRAADLSRHIRQTLKEDTEAVRAVCLELAVFGTAQAVRLTDEEGLVDQSRYKNGWDFDRIPEGAEFGNDAPYAPVLEWGRRPGRPGPPFAPIHEWVLRKLVGAPAQAGREPVTEENAESVAWAIRNKLHLDGYRGREVLRQSMQRVHGQARAAMVRTLRRRHPRR